MKKVLGIAVAMTAWVACANTPPAITNVRASQREGTKLVDIYYDAADADGDLLKVRIEISDNDGARYSVPAFSLTGDIGEGVAPGTGKHIVWDAGTDWDGEYSDQMRVKVFAIDAQGFPGMEWGNEVPPGGFLMGQDGGAEGSGPSRHVNIPWSYWLTKYEITNGQYCDFLNAALAAGVVERDGTTAVYSKMGTQVIPYVDGRFLMLNIGDGWDIRWNVNNFEVVNALTNYPICVSWHGAMMFAHFYGYDLPTEAEWEKAARGPDYDDQDEHLLYPWGNEISAANANCFDNGKKRVGYYDGNQVPIGGNMVNGYGLYDVIGNVEEWTLTDGNLGVETYPQQDSILSYRNLPFSSNSAITRGGSFSGPRAIYFRAITEKAGNNSGFRVLRRCGVERPNPVCEIGENFNGNEWPISSGGTQSVSTTAGQWTLSQGIVRKTIDGDGSWLYSDVGSITYSYDGKDGNVLGTLTYYDMRPLYLPVITNHVIKVQVKTRNTSRYISSIALEGKDSLNVYRGNPIRVAPSSDYQVITLVPTCDATEYRLCFPLLYIDDLEIWTIPRATGE